MSAYTEHFSVEAIDGTRYCLTQVLTWHIGRVDGPLYIVPAGTLFDVSVPWFLAWLFSPHDHRYLKAAALHDHMLEAGWDRPTAAAQFAMALKADRVPLWRRVPMFLATALWRFD